MARIVYCQKLQQNLPGLEKPPYPGELGARIYDNISQQAWDLWLQQATLLINHYGLTLYDPEAREFMRMQMEEFFFGDEAAVPEGWTPPTEQGKGARRKK